ncbi:MAG: MlaD family protein [Saprospiraceae bacterium]|nr:MlaD family protein [Saprospiraceae bacterium]
MSREIKIGAFAFVVLIIAIWGYTYIKGENLLAKSYTFNTSFEDVTQLTESSPVYINGYKVGSVLNISLNTDNLREILVRFYVENDYKIPKDATVVMRSDGLVSGKAISIVFDKQCTGPDCAKTGDHFDGSEIGMIESMLGGNTDEVKEYASVLGSEFTNALSELGAEGGEGAINKTLFELQATMENMTKLTATTNDILSKSARSLTKTIDNMSSITGNLSANNEQITSMLENFNAISTQLKDANVGNTVTSSTAAIESAQKTIESLQGTLKTADQAMKDLDAVLTKANSGDGTLAQLLNDKKLYDNLEMTTKNLSLLLQDFRLNPSRYVKVSVFGGKNKDPYVKPENDPAFDKN